MRNLARIDPATAARLAPTDAQRIQRALEVFALTGMPLSQLHGARETVSAAGPMVPIALLPPDRARLHDAIARRFDAMLAAGLVDELRGLRQRFALTPDLPSMRCVGYRQAWEFLDGAIRCRRAARQGDCRDAPARQTPVHLVARVGGDAVRCRLARRRRHGGGRSSRARASRTARRSIDGGGSRRRAPPAPDAEAA